MTDRIQQFGMSPGRMGTAGMSALTLPGDAPVFHESGPSQRAEFAGDHPAESGSPKAILVGIVFALAAMWLVRENSSVLQREVLGVNLFNLFLVGFTAVLFIWIGKILFARFPVPGFTPLFAGL